MAGRGLAGSGLSGREEGAFTLDEGATQALIAAAGGNAALVNALKEKLDTIIGRDSGFIDELPPVVQNRLRYLRALQQKHDELEEEHRKEREALEKKYEQLYAPLYDERVQVVTGEKEAPKQEGGEEETATPAQAEEETEVPPGIPDFWLNVFRHQGLWAEKISEKDEEILPYLVDVRHERLTGEEQKGFKLIFRFKENPFFDNKELTKSYIMVDEEEPILERSIGTDIQWKQGKNPTVKVMKKKPKKGAKPGAKPITKVEQVESFFNFFSPPEIPDEAEMEEEEVEALQEALEEDYQLGDVIRSRLIPNALRWYTGEALDMDDDDEDYEGEEEEEEEDDEDDDAEDEDDDDDDEEDEDVSPEKPRGGKAKGKKAGPQDNKEQPPECKQQ